MESFVEVFYKGSYGDKKVASIKKRLERVGLKNVKEVIPSTAYKINGVYNKEQVKDIAQNLLTDPVLETCRTTLSSPKGYYKVEVWIRDSSTDVIGESVRDAITAMGFEKPQSVRVGNCFAIKGTFTKSALEAAVKKTFVNEVLNKFTIEGR
ncbi:phosphoribosylformylglycinamidine (FGAM) synthase PurS component [Elusimicrobium simillimum]|uniref:phosphoribosylformylglycinamidine synthase subunit PurS n=1 Tax=Elusimicrobium simillimum TaxID=3143438 RepID=UPI003C704615